MLAEGVGTNRCKIFAFNAASAAIRAALLLSRLLRYVASPPHATKHCRAHLLVLLQRPALLTQYFHGRLVLLPKHLQNDAPARSRSGRNSSSSSTCASVRYWDKLKASMAVIAARFRLCVSLAAGVAVRFDKMVSSKFWKLAVSAPATDRQRTHERSRVLAQFSGNTQLVACFAGWGLRS